MTKCIHTEIYDGPADVQYVIRVYDVPFMKVVISLRYQLVIYEILEVDLHTYLPDEEDENPTVVINKAKRLCDNILITNLTDG